MPPRCASIFRDAPRTTSRSDQSATISLNRSFSDWWQTVSYHDFASGQIGSGEPVIGVAIGVADRGWYPRPRRIGAGVVRSDPLLPVGDRSLADHGQTGLIHRAGDARHDRTVIPPPCAELLEQFCIGREELVLTGDLLDGWHQ